MQHAGSNTDFHIRCVHPEEYRLVGGLIVQAYAGLTGMPTPDEQPEYYSMLADVGKRAGNTAIEVLVAAAQGGEVLGSVDLITDMRHYGSGGTAGSIANAAGIRLLAVASQYRGLGVGGALTRHCIERAAELGRSRLILHTTKAMQTAWSMYERRGFQRFPAIDFYQGALQVFGFQLELARDRA